MVLIEGTKKSINITVLEEKGDGYKGISGSISKESLINKLIDEDILQDGEMVHFEEESE